MSAPQTAPEPSLLQEIVPAFDGGDRDTGQLHSENVKLVMDESALQWALRDLPPQEIDPKRLPKPRAGEQPKGSAIGRAAKDTGLGIVEAPVQAVGGVIDMANSALQLARDLSDGLPNPGLILDAEGVRFGGTEDVRAAEPLQLPTTPGAATATGAAIRSAAQFLSGFAGAVPCCGATMRSRSSRGERPTRFNPRLTRGFPSKFLPVILPLGRSGSISISGRHRPRGDTWRSSAKGGRRFWTVWTNWTSFAPPRGT